MISHAEREKKEGGEQRNRKEKKRNAAEKGGDPSNREHRWSIEEGEQCKDHHVEKKEKEEENR